MTDSNSRNYNSGNYNSGNYNSGDCNTTEPTVRLFNKDSGWKFNDNNHCKFRNIIDSLINPKCEWITELNMTSEEKNNNPRYKTTGGYLRVNDNIRNDKKISEEDRKFLESVPNFCPKVLKECTGIDLEDNRVKIVINNKEIMISEESLQELEKYFKNL